MTDEKEQTKKNILGELESIRTLLDEEEQLDGLDQEPPLLTTPADAEDAPLLTETWDGSAGAAEQSGASPQTGPTSPEDDDDLAGQVSKNRSDSVARKAEVKRGSTEEQPSLFDDGELERKSRTTAPVVEANPGEKAAPGKPLPSPEKSENPFLPQHIRERLSANRILRPTPPARDGSPRSSTKATKKDAEEAAVDELVQRYLPRIEAELREKIRARIRQQRKPAGEPEDEPTE